MRRKEFDGPKKGSAFKFSNPSEVLIGPTSFKDGINLGAGGASDSKLKVGSSTLSSPSNFRSTDEASALAIANLIISNFGGQLSFENILEKNLIPISITKAQQYEMVRNKLREQIIEVLQGKSTDSGSDYEQDLAHKSHSIATKESFTDTEPSAYEGGEFSYL
jgi:hypothetical protein